MRCKTSPWHWANLSATSLPRQMGDSNTRGQKKYPHLQNSLQYIFLYWNIQFSIVPRPKMVQKKVLAMVLLKYYNLQTLQNPMNFQFFRRSINWRLARPKAGLGRACDSVAGRPRAAAAAGRRAVRIGNDLAKMHFLLKNVVLGQFWIFLNLLDLKNGSGSKFLF